MQRTVFACLLLAPSLAAAAPGDFLFDLVADTPSSNADFGDSLAVGDGVIVVGAEDTPDGFTLSAGAVFLYDATTGTQLNTLTTTDPPESRQFGNAVDIDGTSLIIGAQDDTDVTGAAYLFDVDGTQLFRLTASDGEVDDEFGQAVAISGNVAAVGAENAGMFFEGKAYLFDVTTGQQIGAPLQPATLPPAAEFGTSLDMDGDRLIVGTDIGGGGAAFVFDASGTLLYEISPPIDTDTGLPADGFGRAVAISGDRAIISATPENGTTDDIGGQSIQVPGSAYIYDIPTGDLLMELTPDDSTPADLFGDVVDIDGDTALVVSRREDVLSTPENPLPNRAYLFDLTTGQQVAILDEAGIDAGSEAFEAAALSGGIVVAGQESFDSPGFTNNGRALVFDAAIPPSTSLPGDADGDGDVDGDDLIAVQTQFGNTGASPLLGDADADGDVDGDDLIAVQTNFGAVQSVAVPEPATNCLALAALGCWISRRRR